MASPANKDQSQQQPPLYPTISSPTTTSVHENPFYQLPPPPPSSTHQEAAASSSDQQQPPSAHDEKYWGTHVMGTPAVPTCHPDNKKAALFGGGGGGGGGDEAQNHHHHPYLYYSPIEKPNSSPVESILQAFNNWSKKTETMANNIWHNLRTNSSVSEAAWGKMNLTAKAITGGGFESLYKQTFTTYPDEKLKKTFACYLSTSTGPVSGTLYLSDIHTAFCSDRPLSFTAPSGQATWSYYKIMIPLNKIGAINPVVMRDNASEKYIQIVTVDGHDFWFMGFVNYEKASKHLTESVSNFVVPGVAVHSGV
ncbi:GEM-like protein 5 [Mercurialis annua]|uniref:GEM-like protein 5 n=1 Tax=Mercurialis annua TaxID=3986 RepID=UPI00215FDAA4|nr:GEM-like protein 5 [Mercurialis annua]